MDAGLFLIPYEGYQDYKKASFFIWGLDNVNGFFDGTFGISETQPMTWVDSDESKDIKFNEPGLNWPFIDNFYQYGEYFGLSTMQTLFNSYKDTFMLCV